MDICALDGVHSKKDGKEYILELNDSAIGFNSRYYEEDMKDARDLVLQRMVQAEEQRLKEVAIIKKKRAAEVPAKEASMQDLKDEIALLKAQLEQANNRAVKAEVAANSLRKDKEAVPQEKGSISKFFGI